MTYFETKWTLSTIHSEWKIHINPETVEKDWFLRNKSTWGSLRWVAKRIFPIYFIIACISSVGWVGRDVFKWGDTFVLIQVGVGSLSLSLSLSPPPSRAHRTNQQRNASLLIPRWKLPYSLFQNPHFQRLF